MFFLDSELTARKRAILKVPPPIPDTGWRPPSYFPNLDGATVIGIDTETKETDFEHGPGWSRGKGHIVGFSVAAIMPSGDRGKWYFPIRHEVEPEWNLDPKPCLAWLRHTMALPVPKVGANLIYDLGWLATEEIVAAGDLHDVQFAEALLDEQGDTNLDYLGEKYLQRGKETEGLYEWLARAYGGKPTPAQRSNIFRAPPRLVGPYGENDADIPLDVLLHQWPLLENEQLGDLYRMECESIPMLIGMRFQGVKVNVPFAEQLHAELGRDIKAKYEKLRADFGVNIETVNSPGELSKLFDHVGVAYPKTELGNPSFVKDWLKALDHPAGLAVNDIREYEKVRGTFVESYLLEANIKGIIHTVFHPLRSDEGGAKTGRYASSDPNLQNIPIRTKVGKRVRKAFEPFEGHRRWRKYDHSQIEYRMLANFASGPGAEELRAEYRDNPATDYHDRVMTQAAPFMGWDLATMPDAEKKEHRRPLKNINFGLIYGQAEASLAHKSGMDSRAAKAFFGGYHQAAPYVRPTMKAIGAEAQTYGFVRTLLNRRTRFNLWEPIEYDKLRTVIPLPFELAVRRYGYRIKRAFEYRAVNYKLQGSAADCIKHGMLTCYKSGVYDFIGLPLLQVHDELDHSEKDDSPAQEEAYRFMQYTLENSVRSLLHVPLRVDVGFGPTWGDID